MDKALKNKKLGIQFNRQFPIKLNDKNIIVDFIYRKLKLIIEIDGYSHNFKYKEDMERDAQLQKMGYTILRFSEHNVKHDLDNVVRSIENAINSNE